MVVQGMGFIQQQKIKRQTISRYLRAAYAKTSKSMNENILPKSNQPGQHYGIRKAHEFNNIEDISLCNLNFRPIIAQSGTYNIMLPTS